VGSYAGTMLQRTAFREASQARALHGAVWLRFDTSWYLNIVARWILSMVIEVAFPLRTDESAWQLCTASAKVQKHS
jgi:hypothetical protein